MGITKTTLNHLQWSGSALDATAADIKDTQRLKQERQPMPKPKTIRAEKITIGLRVYKSLKNQVKEYADNLNEKYEYERQKEKFEKKR